MSTLVYVLRQLAAGVLFAVAVGVVGAVVLARLVGVTLPHGVYVVAVVVVAVSVAAAGLCLRERDPTPYQVDPEVAELERLYQAPAYRPPGGRVRPAAPPDDWIGGDHG